MKKEVFKKTAFTSLRSAIATVLFTVAIITMIIFGLNQTERSSREEGLNILEDGLRRAVVTCYAVEGRYPESLSYIEEHYGVYIDRNRYAVYYEIFASNILPDITVITL